MNRIIIALLILPFFIACNQKEIKQLKEQNLALAKVTSEKEIAINDFVTTLNSIEENLDIIRVKEKIVTENSENPDKSQRTKIESTLTSINDILEQNRLKIDNLDKRINKSWYQNSKLRKLTTRLKNDVTSKEADIVILTEQIAKLDIKIDGLNTQVDNLNTTVTDLATQNTENSKLIEEKTNSLNTAYYYIGTASDLKEKQIASKKGGIIGVGSTTILDENFNTKEFKEIDIRETNLIPIKGEKIDLVTTHPLSSFKFEAGKGLSIINIEQFWKSSKYLVIKI
ncbi:hypothetical protein [Ancylomarina sp. 16SWW S1-10-2]|uniref:Cbp1 family collagen-binding glycoprotein adhesin n=1 Tax=Ancylomarina sp. 16SWW S1-10-2 TaxID=2499681 RepID=UPI0012AE8EB8|nr:hypothetical protein [Ancylomarina sp. 16SWW S1-10-2]MRT92451.1 hypothetical protein [Ancylomarina sp. 16SWW S1-10-2]